MSKTTASNNSTPTEKDPQPSVDRIDDIARRILTGDILLPKFQRGFVWTRDQVRKLWDSVAKGYPIGGVLLWQSRQKLASEQRIADLNIQMARLDYPVNYLLDGQQRLSAICGAVHWSGDDTTSVWNMAYDLREKNFVHLNTLDDPPPHQIRVNKLSDPANYFQQVTVLASSKVADAAELRVHADTFFRRFMSYKIATVTLGDMSIEDVAPIFERINSTGTRLTIVDLMRAATWSPSFDLVDSIERILSDLNEKDFGEISKKTVLRNISASAGGGFSKGSIDDLRKLDVGVLKEAVRATHDAYKMAVDYLRTQVGVPNASILPYQNQVVVLAEFFRLHPRPQAHHYSALKAWFWKTAASGYFSGWNTGQMRRDHASVKEFAKGLANEIVVDVEPPYKESWKTGVFKRSNAQAKLLAILLAHQKPVDLLTGQKIDVAGALSRANSREFHHFFPRAFLKQRGCDAAKANSLANIVILTSLSNKKILNKAPSQYLKDVATAAGADLSRWLEVNLISQEAWAAALRDDYDSFLRARAETLHGVTISLCR